MSQSKEVVREAYGDAAKESANNTSCCGPSCCNAESTSDRPKNVSSEKYGDEARRPRERRGRTSPSARTVPRGAGGAEDLVASLPPHRR